ncbi:hypothetical protein K469DRAFT_700440 [Zopfia rhizophila CBS 207.26]|uniref:Uncharacterized protein n=1 Tax=Zopfia rhizophila CBS 207.26 TaxID=1314779 RepID=A0A6A6DCD4_9PEZI|nr:hypothetical protein K469DRAFT_700440 [Zopfia rhizophila CBS 207.26]
MLPLSGLGTKLGHQFHYPAIHMQCQNLISVNLIAMSDARRRSLLITFYTRSNRRSLSTMLPERNSFWNKFLVKRS